MDISKNNIFYLPTEIITFVENNSTLTNLNLSYNQIRPNGIADLLLKLEQNNKLKSLDLTNNYLEEDGGILIHNLLKKNSNITALGFTGNLMVKQTEKETAYLIKKNTNNISKKMLLLINKRNKNIFLPKCIIRYIFDFLDYEINLYLKKKALNIENKKKRKIEEINDKQEEEEEDNQDVESAEGNPDMVN